MSDVRSVVNLIESAVGDADRNFNTIGAALCLVADEKLFKDYATHTTSMEKFLREFKFSRSWAWNAMRVNREFGGYDLENVPHDRLVRILPLQIPEEYKAGWVEAARVLSAGAFNDEIRNYKGLVATDQCDHTDIEVIKKCKNCKMVMK